MNSSNGSSSQPASPVRGPSPARAIALRVLSDLREGRQTAREAIDDLLVDHPASAQDRSLATELVMGVVRHRLTLIRLLGQFTTRGWQRVNHRLQQILMMGAYQLVWLDGIPEFAAVDEAVMQGRQEGGARAGHFINAVLRSLIRDRDQRRLPADQADPRRSVWVASETACQFRRPFLADPQDDPIAYWSDATSHPAWLVARWRETYGAKKTIEICRAGMERAPLVLRPNRLRIDATRLISKLADEGIVAQALPGGAGIVVISGPSPMQTRAFAEGMFQPQDRTAMEVAPAACGEDIGPGQVIVDVCAGLGTKATQFAEMTDDRGVILATDKDAGKLELLAANAMRLGCQSIQILPIAEVATRVEAIGGAHCVLVDVPCSNTGVLARRPEARYRMTQRTLENLSALQTSLLEESVALLRPGGRLVYATCSIDPQENEQVAARFGQSHPEWQPIASRVTLPQVGPSPLHWRDGGYWAAWRRPR